MEDTLTDQELELIVAGKVPATEIKFGKLMVGEIRSKPIRKFLTPVIAK